MCVVVVVEMDSDVIVCALTSTPVSPAAFPSSYKKNVSLYIGILKTLFSQEKRPVFPLNTFFNSARTEI